MHICKDDLKKPTAAEYSDKEHRNAAKLGGSSPALKNKYNCIRKEQRSRSVM